MDHGLNNDFLCTASMIITTFRDDTGKEISKSGTSFFVNNKAGQLCLITNRHVVDIDYKEPTAKYKNFKLQQVIVHNREKNRDTGLPTGINALMIANFGDFQYSETFANDVACLRTVVASDYKKGTYASSVDYHIPYEFIADEPKLRGKLCVCDMVAFPGYPPWYDRKNNLPILRTGSIASDPRFDYSHTEEDNGSCIAYEAFSFGGSSGSPVFAVQKGIRVGAGLSGGSFREVMLIGINAGHLPVDGPSGAHSGISYLYKSSVILELIDK